jgi:hypothetical protein
MPRAGQTIIVGPDPPFPTLCPGPALRFLTYRVTLSSSPRHESWQTYGTRRYDIPSCGGSRPIGPDLTGLYGILEQAKTVKDPTLQMGAPERKPAGISLLPCVFIYRLWRMYLHGPWRGRGGRPGLGFLGSGIYGGLLEITPIDKQAKHHQKGVTLGIFWHAWTLWLCSKTITKGQYIREATAQSPRPFPVGGGRAIEKRSSWRTTSNGPSLRLRGSRS